MGARSSSVVRVGIVGAGFAASSHIDALRRIPNVRLEGVLASSPERTAAAAERLGVEASRSWTTARSRRCRPQLHAERRARIDHRGRPRTPASTFCRRSRSGSTRPRRDGWHMRPADAASSPACASTTGTSLSSRRCGACSRDGGDGPIHLVHGAYLQDWLLRPDDWNWRLESASAGTSRATGDIGSHWIDLAQHVTGDAIVSVTARLGTLFDERVQPPEGDRQTFAGGRRDGTDAGGHRGHGGRALHDATRRDGIGHDQSGERRLEEPSRARGRCAERRASSGTRRSRTTFGSAGATARTETCFAIRPTPARSAVGSRTSPPGIRRVAGRPAQPVHRLLRRGGRPAARRAVRADVRIVL
jgi:hypothetical protein